MQFGSHLKPKDFFPLPRLVLRFLLVCRALLRSVGFFGLNRPWELHVHGVLWELVATNVLQPSTVDVPSREGQSVVDDVLQVDNGVRRGGRAGHNVKGNR